MGLRPLVLFLSFFFRYQSPLFSLAMPPTATYLLCLYCDGAGRKDRYWNFMTKEIIQRKRKKKKEREGKGKESARCCYFPIAGEERGVKSGGGKVCMGKEGDIPFFFFFLSSS